MHRIGLTSSRVGGILIASAWMIVAACTDFTAADRFKPDPRLPTHDQLQEALAAARATDNGGFNLDMWGSVVDREGRVVAVAFTGAKEGDQWRGSRVISAQKANTANAFSLPDLALSTANLYAASQPGGTLFGLQESNPVDPDVAYGGDEQDYGTKDDFMVGKRIGGINVFGGGLALYSSDGEFIGGVGVSGDASCADHNIAWKTRFNLQLDHVPAGVADGGADDNIIYDIDSTGVSPSGFGHPECSAAATAISEALPTDFPIGH
ncbi:MAG TPA: heme-binding protein [Gemmatimonadaceae bacterium]|nr:heme-binding protein [Gemmatimonadaceae bacterium]